MPWYTAKPFSDRWGWHWTMNYFDPEQSLNGKRQIASHYYPLIGPYDSGDPHVLEYHLLLMKLAGIDGVIVDWYGLTSFRDYAILNRNTTRVLQQCERLKMKFVICYEDQTIPALVEANRIKQEERVDHAVNEIRWLSKYWFKSGAYARLRGDPILLSFGHSGLTNGEWGECLKKLDVSVAYFSQDYQRDGAIGGFGWPSPKRGLRQTDRFLIDAKRWPATIPAAFPRFVDIYRKAKVSDGYPELPDMDGKTFHVTLVKALESNAPIIQLVTWNDWGEGTQIEPSVEFGYRDLEYLQRVRRKYVEPDFVPDASVLALPRQILQRRRSNSGQPQVLDDAVNAICEGDLVRAKSLLESMPTE
jgi:hypothetical protein